MQAIDRLAYACTWLVEASRPCGRTTYEPTRIAIDGMDFIVCERCAAVARMFESIRDWFGGRACKRHDAELAKLKAIVDRYRAKDRRYVQRKRELRNQKRAAARRR